MSKRLSLLRSLAASEARENIEGLASEVKAGRESLGRLMSELDHWVRQALDPVLRRRHPLVVFGLGGLGFFVLGGVVGIALRRNRRADVPTEEARRHPRTVTPIVEDPNRVAHPVPSILREVLGAAGAVIAAAVAKKLIDRAFSSRV